MEYIFGTNEDKEILKTKGDSHSNISGFQQIERKYPDQNIRDSFNIVKKINSAEDDDGNCYDWYEIDRHYRECDKSEALMAKIDYVAMMSDIDLDETEEVN